MALKSIEEQIWENSKNTPDKTAIVSGKKSITYAQLVDGILAAKKYYENELKIPVGSNIILAAGKHIEFSYAYFGAHLAGLRVCPIDAATNPARLKFVYESTNAAVLIGFDKADIEGNKISLKDFSDLPANKQSEIVFPGDEDIADILFTTGTTGTPKGVPLTFDNEAAAARNINDFIGNTSEDVELLALPISHSFGLGRLRCCLTKGATIILLGSFANVKRLFRIMEEDHVTGFTMVPASWRYLLRYTGNKLGEFASQLKYIEMGSAYFSKDEKHQLVDLLPNTRVCMHYGLTEASRSAFMEFHEDADYLESVGKASPNTDIKVFGENGIELQVNQEGEICVKGEHVTKGYMNHSDDDTFFGDYFRTGDWGYINEKGYVYLKSRKKELINVGGKKITPIEVETELLKINGIADCAVIGIPDPDGMLGEVVKAFIVKDEDTDITFDDIKSQLQGKLEGYQQPAIYEWIDEVPRTQNGKIQRLSLK